jgi:hypothetical protein
MSKWSESAGVSTTASTTGVGQRDPSLGCFVLTALVMHGMTGLPDLQ